MTALETLAGSDCDVDAILRSLLHDPSARPASSPSEPGFVVEGAPREAGDNSRLEPLPPRAPPKSFFVRPHPPSAVAASTGSTHISAPTGVPKICIENMAVWPTDESGTPGWESERTWTSDRTDTGPYAGLPTAVGAVMPGGRPGDDAPVEADWHRRVDAFLARKSEEQWVIWHAITSMLSRSALVAGEEVDKVLAAACSPAAGLPRATSSQHNLVPFVLDVECAASGSPAEVAEWERAVLYAAIIEADQVFEKVCSPALTAPNGFS